MIICGYHVPGMAIYLYIPRLVNGIFDDLDAEALVGSGAQNLQCLHFDRHGSCEGT